jgi:hypothetical protein
MDRKCNLLYELAMPGRKVALDRIVEDLYRQYSHWLRSGRVSRELRDLHEEVAKIYAPVNDGSITSFLTGIHAAKAPSVHLFLRPPPESKILPIVELMGDVEKEQLRARLALFTFSEARTLAGIGFRYETSEGTDSRHDFNHVQLIRAFKKGGAEFPQVPAWLPTRQPAIPISAKGPTMMFVNLLVSLYGMKIFADFREALFAFDLAGELRSLQEGCGCVSASV